MWVWGFLPLDQATRRKRVLRGMDESVGYEKEGYEWCFGDFSIIVKGVCELQAETPEQSSNPDKFSSWKQAKECSGSCLWLLAQPPFQWKRKFEPQWAELADHLFSIWSPRSLVGAWSTRKRWESHPGNRRSFHLYCRLKTDRVYHGVNIVFSFSLSLVEECMAKTITNGKSHWSTTVTLFAYDKIR